MSRSLTRRMLGAAALRVEVYEDVEADRGATGQAAVVVGIVAVAAALGGVVEGRVGVVSFLVAQYVEWLVWAGVTLVVGDWLFGGRATWGELLRTLGFARAPGVLYVLAAVVPGAWIVRVGVGIWLVVAAFIAIRQALDVGNVRTFFTVVIGGVAQAFLEAGAYLLATGASAVP